MWQNAGYWAGLVNATKVILTAIVAALLVAVGVVGELQVFGKRKSSTTMTTSPTS
jgi:hypothetical protein